MTPADITLKKVKAAYGKIGKTPAQGVGDGKNCCCALVALCLSDDLSTHDFCHMFSDRSARGFMYGFDGKEPVPNASYKYFEWYDCGREIAVGLGLIADSV